MDAYTQQELIREANQKEIQARMVAEQQTRNDLIEGTKQLAEEREKRLKELEEKRNQYKEVTPVSIAEELASLREQAKIADAQEELQVLRKRFEKDGE